MLSRRGIFGVFAGLAAAPLVQLPATGGWEQASVIWFSRKRFIGLLECKDGREVCIDRAAVKDELRLGQQVWVRWVEMPNKKFLATEVMAAV
jgi:cold shock CspA family protein